MMDFYDVYIEEFGKGYKIVSEWSGYNSDGERYTTQKVKGPQAVGYVELYPYPQGGTCMLVRKAKKTKLYVIESKASRLEEVKP